MFGLCLTSPVLASVQKDIDRFEFVQKKLIQDGFNHKKIQRLYRRPNVIASWQSRRRYEKIYGVEFQRVVSELSAIKTRVGQQTCQRVAAQWSEFVIEIRQARHDTMLSNHFIVLHRQVVSYCLEPIVFASGKT